MKSAFMFPIYLATNKILYRDIKEDISEGRGARIQERPIVGPNRAREAKLTHGN